MTTLIDWIVVGCIGAALLAPVTYALATLRGMRHKRVYPILRLKGGDGQVSLVQESGGGSNAIRRNGEC